MTATIDQSTLLPLIDGNLAELAKIDGAPCVSIFMRTHRSGT